MRNGRKEKQSDAPFVAFYDMRAVTSVLPDEMAIVSIAGLQWFILILRLNHHGSHRPSDSPFQTLFQGTETRDYNALFDYVDGRSHVKIEYVFLPFLRRIVWRQAYFYSAEL